MRELDPRLRDWIVFISLALGIPLAAISELRSSDASEPVVFGSALLCLLGFNLYFSILLRSRKKRVGVTVPNGFWAGVVLLMVFSALGTLWAGSFVAARNTYLAIALSGKPLQDIHPERKRLVIALYRRRLANSLEEDKEIAEARKHPIDPSLYSPASFANNATIKSVKAQLQAAYEMDHAYFLKQQEAMMEFESEMGRVDPTYLQSWKDSEASHEASDLTADRLETEWFDATISFYDYTAAHLSEITFRNNKLVFANEGIHLAFAMQQAHCQDIQEKMLEKVREQALTHRKPAI